MHRVKHMIAGGLVVAILLSAGFAIAQIVNTDPGASAQTESEWTAVSVPFFCADCFLSSDADGNVVGQPQVADPDGRQDIFVNLIAKLDRDGCQWQWDTMSWSGSDQIPVLSYMILYRC